MRAEVSVDETGLVNMGKLLDGTIVCDVQTDRGHPVVAVRVPMFLLVVCLGVAFWSGVDFEVACPPSCHSICVSVGLPVKSFGPPASAALVEPMLLAVRFVYGHG